MSVDRDSNNNFVTLKIPWERKIVFLERNFFFFGYFEEKRVLFSFYHWRIKNWCPHIRHLKLSAYKWRLKNRESTSFCQHCLLCFSQNLNNLFVHICVCIIINIFSMFWKEKFGLPSGITLVIFQKIFFQKIFYTNLFLSFFWLVEVYLLTSWILLTN